MKTAPFVLDRSFNKVVSEEDWFGLEYFFEASGMDSHLNVGLASSFLLSFRNDRLQLILVKCDIDQYCFVCPCSSVCLDSFPNKDTPIDEQNKCYTENYESSFPMHKIEINE